VAHLSAQMIRMMFSRRFLFLGLELGVLFAIASGPVDNYIFSSKVNISLCLAFGYG
jgi:hypothetical protein